MQKQRLATSFILPANPAKVYRGTVQHIDMAVRTNEQGRATVLVRVKFNPKDLPERKPGMVAVARIHCGRRSLGYVWLHDLIDLVRTWTKI
jgi:hypothetical protein